MRRGGGRLAATVLAVGLAVAGCTGEAGSPPTDTVAAASDLPACPATGSAAAGEDTLPGLDFPCLSGVTPFPLGDAPGVPTVLNLWAPWCAPCREELPLFQELHVNAPPAALRVLGLVERDTAASSVAYANEVGLQFPNGLDAGGDLMTEQGLNGLPATYFLRPDGQVAFRQIGPIASYADLRALVAEHLGVDVP